MNHNTSTALMALYPPTEVEFVRGEGVWLIDRDGRRYLDFLAGIAVVSLGHANPRVTKALCDQAAKLVHCSNLFANEHCEPAARAITELFGPEAHRVFFTNSGAEANEAAIKLVRKARPGRPGIVSFENSFHGRTLGALSATHQPAKQLPFAPLVPGFVAVPYNDVQRSVSALQDPTVGGVFLEVIQGEAGVIDGTQEFLDAVVNTARANDVLVVIDEVQSGMGRTGRWFGFDHAGLNPDIVTLAKALGNGVPVGAMVARESVGDAFAVGDHGTTYGGNPLVTAVVRVVIDEMRARNLPEHAGRVGQILREGLLGIDGVASVSGRGLLVGVELADPIAALVARVALGNGLIVNAIGLNRIRLAPPLVVGEAEVADALEILDRSIQEAHKEVYS
ncbi:MAG: aspartate aminotransferase family protein [Ferrimicrobium sp.]